MSQLKRVAVICDGPNDFTVLKAFLQFIFKCCRNTDLPDEYFFNLQAKGINIINDLSKYIDKVGKSNDYSLQGNYATELRKSIIAILHSSLKSIQRDTEEPMTNKDIMLLHADAEKVLSTKHNYFENWAYTLSGILWMAVEEFYHKMADQGYTYQNLPLVLPLILFPSTEILLAACMHDVEVEGFRELPANPPLKQKVWETPNPTGDVVAQVVDMCFEEEANLERIYHELPETRKIIQVLCAC